MFRHYCEYIGVALNSMSCSTPSPRVRHRPHRVLLSLDQQSPAYLDEEYLIAIDITNADSQELDIVLDVLLQPTEIDHAGL
jgi:trafficking protein particle complex subunit 11